MIVMVLIINLIRPGLFGAPQAWGGGDKMIPYLFFDLELLWI